jgi:hypothetical protein
MLRVHVLAATAGRLRSRPVVQTDARPWRLLPPQAKAGQAYDSAAQGAQQAKDYTHVRRALV